MPSMLTTMSVVVVVVGSVEQSRLPARLIITLHGDPNQSWIWARHGVAD